MAGREKTKEEPLNSVSGENGTEQKQSGDIQAPFSLKQVEELVVKRLEAALSQRGQSFAVTDGPQPARPARKKELDRMEEYVEIKLFKDNKDYKDDKFVAVNGERCLIQRGKRVKIKRKFAQVLEQGEIQDMNTALMCEEKATQFKAEAEQRNL